MQTGSVERSFTEMNSVKSTTIQLTPDIWTVKGVQAMKSARVTAAKTDRDARETARCSNWKCQK